MLQFSDLLKETIFRQLQQPLLWQQCQQKMIPQRFSVARAAGCEEMLLDYSYTFLFYGTLLQSTNQ